MYFGKEIAFGGLTQLVRHHEKHTACKKLCDEVLVWLLSGAKCI